MRKFAKHPLSLTSALLAVSLSACDPDATRDTSTPGAGELAAVDQALTWSRVYRHDFVDLHDVNAFQSSIAVNSALTGDDTSNSDLQKPTLESNVAVVGDAAAVDGKAMAVYTRKANYETDSGTVYGWTNGRMMINGQNHAPPVRIRVRLRMTASVKVKSAVMWWPAGGGWPWEVDFVETFGGTSLTDYWGSRQNVGQRWHADLNGDGSATEQLIHDDAVDATQYHIYDLHITPSRMWINIDGVTKYETTDTRYIPDNAGFFSIGKALTHRRYAAERTNDTVFVDWLEIYKGI
jgi:hypothetical protein